MRHLVWILLAGLCGCDGLKGLSEEKTDLVVFRARITGELADFVPAGRDPAEVTLGDEVRLVTLAGDRVRPIPAAVVGAEGVVAQRAR